LFFVLVLLASSASHRTALDDYVQAPDNHYHYELAEKIPQKGYTAYLLHMTSQQWRGPNEVNRPIWRHWVTIYKPEAVNSSIGLLFITGGSDDEHPKLDSMLASIATTTKSVVTELRDIPNQPLTFAGDPFGPRKEDEIIAYTWRKFIDTGDANWPLRLPMTKAAVRAMDTVTSFLETLQPPPVRVDHFVVAGESKRGWTTWTTAAVDRRVVAIVPIVIDVLNVIRSFQHHYRCYGFWAPAVKDYFDMKLMDVMDTKRYRELMAISDPYSYRDRYTMPKLLINSAGDQFFLPDSSRFYFDELPGEKYLSYEPNSDHSLKGTDLKEAFTAFYQSVLDGSKRPSFQWTFEHDNAIRVTTKETPAAVKLWQASNPEHRDFRLESVGPIYRSSLLEPESPSVYVARIAKAEKGWTAFFVELTYQSDGKYPFKFTTAVRVVPDTEPYPAPKPGKTRMGGE
jgi:PhoPQ-activated pathogenicity-related protein